jgi:ubiquinone/menaquinone biosynthesis C-methylase UbiE
LTTFWNRAIRLPIQRFFEGILLRRQVERLYLVFGGHIFFQTLRTAVKLGLFSLLAKEGRLTRRQIAERLGIEEQPARIVLLGCTAVGLLRKHGQTYSNSYLANRLLVQGKRGNITSYVELEHLAMYKAMPWMYDAVCENRNVGLREFRGDEPTVYQRLAHYPEVELIFQDAMQELSVQANADLARFVDFSQIKHVVDVGGGDGTNAIELARHWPHLRATVFDSLSVCNIARQNIDASGLANRVDAVPGDCFADPYPADADCLLFAHFFTIWSEKKDRWILKKCFDSLPSGGRVIVFNMMQRDDETGPLSAAIGSPYFLTLATGEGMLYTWNEYENWMCEAGFTNVQREVLLRDHGAIIGTKP